MKLYNEYCANLVKEFGEESDLVKCFKTLSANEDYSHDEIKALYYLFLDYSSLR